MCILQNLMHKHMTAIDLWDALENISIKCRKYQLT